MTACNAEGEPMRWSAYQYKPAWLLYRDADWRGVRPEEVQQKVRALLEACLLYTSPSPRD
eukprot:12023801-Alexandrium_andersonii.AAC.1